MAVAYKDHFGSVARRAAQDEKDAAELADERVLAVPFGDKKAGPFLKLRPILERVMASTPRVKTLHERAVRYMRRLYKKGRLNKAQLRLSIASERPRVDAPVKS